jgi:hypothetical protein
MPPFNWRDDEEMAGDRIGCLLVVLAAIALAAGFVILYITTSKLP